MQHSDAVSRLCRNTQPFSWCHQASSQICGFSENTLARCSLAAKRFWAFWEISFGHIPRSAREPDLFLGETSITSLTMTAHPSRAVIRWQPFGASYFPGVTARIWRKLSSVTGSEINMCDVLSPPFSVNIDILGSDANEAFNFSFCLQKGWRTFGTFFLFDFAYCFHISFLFISSCLTRSDWII